LQSLTQRSTEISPDFWLGVQQDAHEFLLCLLDNLHNCCLEPNFKDQPSSMDKDSIVKHVYGGRSISQVPFFIILLNILIGRLSRFFPFAKIICFINFSCGAVSVATVRIHLNLYLISAWKLLMQTPSQMLWSHSPRWKRLRRPSSPVRAASPKFWWRSRLRLTKPLQSFPFTLRDSGTMASLFTRLISLLSIRWSWI